MLNWVSFTYGQKLSVEQVTDILGEIATLDFKDQLENYEGDIEIKFTVTDYNIIIDYCWNNNTDVTFEADVNNICNTLILNLTSVSEILKTKNKYGKYIVQLQCLSGDKDCVSFERRDIINYYHNFMHDDPDSRNHYDFTNLFYFENYESQELIYNGLNYLIYELNEKRNQRTNSLKNFDFSEGASITKVDLISNGGVSEVPINLSGIEVYAILDSGASDVSLPEKIEYILLENGILKERNYLPPGFYIVADGRTVLSRRFIIPEIKIQGVVVNNVICSVNESEDIVLLGRAFLDAFKSWSIDNETDQLILKY